jgi:diacylglycerol kinase family enzyme
VGGFLLVNARSGSDEPSADELAAAAVEAGIDVHVLGDGDDPAELAAGAPSGPIGVAGGDGSLAAVAAVAIDRYVPFVCVPLGTRNHFARDAGLDRDDPLGALAAFEGDERRIDVGDAGGRIFLNNVSFGVYADLVRHRERHRRRGESLARLRALARVAAGRSDPLELRVDGERLRVRAALVSNNRYELSALSLGERPALDEATLHFYCAASFFPHGWHDRSAPAFDVATPGATRVRAAIDGEPAVLEPRVRFSVRPGALRLLVPRGTDG